MAKKVYEVSVPADVDEIVIRLHKEETASIPRMPAGPLPLYAQITSPEQVPETWSALITGLHVRFRQTDAEPHKVRGILDACQARGWKAGLVIAVHSARKGEAGGVFTRHTRRLPDGEIIPDYWSDTFFREWLAIRRAIAAEVKDHPALAWVGVDFGLDDEAWPAKPWQRVPREWWWGYITRYVTAAWELAHLFAPVPVVAQVATFLRQGLEMLYWGFQTHKPPSNLGIKYNGFHVDPNALPVLEAKIRPFWDWCRNNRRLAILEPGMVPTGKPERDLDTAAALFRRALEWKADILVLQKEFLDALAVG